MKLWLCSNCIPDEPFEELTIGLVFRSPCHNCGEWIEPDKAHCVLLSTWLRWVGEGKIPNYNCTRCFVGIVLADTEDWKKPLCYECWHEMGEPAHEIQEPGLKSKLDEESSP